MHGENGSVLVAVLSGTLIVCERETTMRPPIYWKLPGGRIEEHETPKQAAVRELAEETGINVEEHELTLLSKTPQTSKWGAYTQYLFATKVPYEKVAQHDGHLVVRYDDEGARIESTCFDVNEAEHMADFMRKHLDILRSARRQPVG